MKNLTKKNVLLIAAMACSGLFVFMPEIMAAIKPAQDEVQQQIPLPPTPVTTQVFEENGKIDIPELSKEDRFLQTLEYNAKVSQLQASIAESESKRDKARFEQQRGTAELDKLNAETDKIKAEIIRTKMEGEAELIEIKNRKTEDPAPVAPTPVQVHSPMVPPFQPMQGFNNSAPQITQPVSPIQVGIRVNRISNNSATLTVDSEMQNLAIGSEFNGIRLISISDDRRSVVTQNVRTGKRITSTLSLTSSRRFSAPDTFESTTDSSNQGQGSEIGQSSAIQPGY
jgi:hypothetical protein